MTRTTRTRPLALTQIDDSVWDSCLSNAGSVFLDYDGTLTPIVSRPELAIMSEAVRTVIRRLATRWPVTIVSGRDISVIRGLVGVQALGYVGSHGLDIVGPPGSGLRHEVGHAFLGELDDAERQLKSDTAEVEGVVIERKRFSISVHVRQASPIDLPLVAAIVDRLADGYPSLRQEGGKMLHELRPDVDWDKGAAVRWLLDQTGREASRALYIGDDLTDETVFSAFAGQGITVVVADANEDRPTAAGFRLDDPADVQTLLERLVRHAMSTDS